MRGRIGHIPVEVLKMAINPGTGAESQRRVQGRQKRGQAACRRLEAPPGHRGTEALNVI